jgi:hypothetical protein
MEDVDTLSHTAWECKYHVVFGVWRNVHGSAIYSPSPSGRGRGEGQVGTGSESTVEQRHEQAQGDVAAEHRLERGRPTPDSFLRLEGSPIGLPIPARGFQL